MKQSKFINNFIIKDPMKLREERSKTALNNMYDNTWGKHIDEDKHMKDLYKMVDDTWGRYIAKLEKNKLKERR